MSARTQTVAVLVARGPFRRQIASALTGHGVAVVAELADPDGALLRVVESMPALLVVELSAEVDAPELVLRNERMLEFVRAARQRIPGLNVIAVTESFDPGLISAALTNGVDAYLVGAEAS
jgi:DNA-binding NarL/FixJ family response regulator